MGGEGRLLTNCGEPFREPEFFLVVIHPGQPPAGSKQVGFRFQGCTPDTGTAYTICFSGVYFFLSCRDIAQIVVSIFLLKRLTRGLESLWMGLYVTLNTLTPGVTATLSQVALTIRGRWGGRSRQNFGLVVPGRYDGAFDPTVIRWPP